MGLATACVWRGALAVPFHFDDHHAVVNNLEIRNLGNCRGFLQDFFARGVLKVGLAINYAFASKSPGGEPRPEAFHVVNLAIHALNSVLAFLLARALLIRGPMPLTAGMSGLAAAATARVWGMAPLHAMAVNLAASRAETQAAFFMLVCLNLAVPALYADRPRFIRAALLGLSLMSAALAVGSKSVAVAVFPLGGLAFWYARCRPPGLRAVVHTVALVCMVAVGLSAGLIIAGDIWQSHYHGMWANLCTQAPVVLNYAWLLLAPSHVNLIHDVPLRTGSDAASLLSLSVLITALAIGLLLAGRRDWLGFGILWYLIAIAPSSSIIPRTESMLEYRSYLATLGLAGVLVCVVARAGSWIAGRTKARRLGMWPPAALLTTWVIIFAVHTMHINRAYGDALALWSRTVRLEPNSFRAHHGYARALFDAGRNTEAIEHYRRSIDLQAGFPNNYWNLAAAMAAQNDLAGAERELRRGLTVAPDQANAYVNLGVIRRRLNDRAGAVAAFERALALDSAHCEGSYNLADVLCERGEFDSAARLYEAALRVKPAYAKALAGLAAARQGAGASTEAQGLAQQALAIDPNEATAYAALADVLSRSGCHAEAFRITEEGLARSPGHRLLIRKKAWLLAACPVPELRDGAAAGRLAALLVHASGGADPLDLDLLAAAHACAGRFEAAASTCRRALALLRDPHDRHLIEQITKRLELYGSRRAYLHPARDPEPNSR